MLNQMIYTFYLLFYFIYFYLLMYVCMYVMYVCMYVCTYLSVYLSIYFIYLFILFIVTLLIIHQINNSRVLWILCIPTNLCIFNYRNNEIGQDIFKATNIGMLLLF